MGISCGTGNLGYITRVIMTSIWRRPVDLVLVVIFSNFIIISATIGMISIWAVCTCVGSFKIKIIIEAVAG